MVDFGNRFVCGFDMLLGVLVYDFYFIMGIFIIFVVYDIENVLSIFGMLIKYGII